MPMVGGKKFPYTKAGKAAAEKAEKGLYANINAKKKQSAADKALVIGESRKRLVGIENYAIGVNRAIGHLDVSKKYNVGYKATMGKNVPYELDTQLVTSKKFGKKPTTGRKAYVRAMKNSNAMPGDQYALTGKKRKGKKK